MYKGQLPRRRTPRIDLTTFGGRFQSLFCASTHYEIRCDSDRKRLTLWLSALRSWLSALSPRTPRRPQVSLRPPLRRPAQPSTSSLNRLLFSATNYANVHMSTMRAAEGGRLIHALPKSHRMSKSRWGNFWTSEPSRSAEPRRTGTHEVGRCRSARGIYRVPGLTSWRIRISPHPERILSPPGAKFRPFRLTITL
jgi:hypothetical protein